MTAATYQLPEVVSLEHVLKHSFRDFHAKGFDYLCLERTNDRTIKAYFLEGEAAESPEVVMPHNHRYGFATGVLAGEVVNHNYLRSVGGRRSDLNVFDEFEYRTPLNGGSGFTWKREEYLTKVLVTRLTPSSRPFHQRARDIHTISVTPGTVISQVQKADEIPVGKPTASFRLLASREPPDLSGLYRPMDADHAIQRIETFYELAGIPLPRIAA